MVRKASYIALIAVLFSGLLVFTGCRRNTPQKGAAFMVDYMAEVLDLNDVQMETLEQIKEEILEKAEQLRADGKAMHKEAMVQLGSDVIDKEQLKKAIANHRARMDEMVDLAVDRLAEFHQMLTPDQKTKLVSKLEKFEKWHRHGWE
jgi:uncharacterized membrane protein